MADDSRFESEFGAFVGVGTVLAVGARLILGRYARGDAAAVGRGVGARVGEAVGAVVGVGAGAGTAEGKVVGRIGSVAPGFDADFEGTSAVCSKFHQLLAKRLSRNPTATRIIPPKASFTALAIFEPAIASTLNGAARPIRMMSPAAIELRRTRLPLIQVPLVERRSRMM